MKKKVITGHDVPDRPLAVSSSVLFTIMTTAKWTIIPLTPQRFSRECNFYLSVNDASYFLSI